MSRMFWHSILNPRCTMLGFVWPLPNTYALTPLEHVGLPTDWMFWVCPISLGKPPPTHSWMWNTQEGGRFLRYWNPNACHWRIYRGSKSLCSLAISQAFLMCFSEHFTCDFTYCTWFHMCNLYGVTCETLALFTCYHMWSSRYLHMS